MYRAVPPPAAALRLHAAVARQVVANDWAFAARRDDGIVICWGDPASGGDTSAIEERLRQAGPETAEVVPSAPCTFRRRHRLFLASPAGRSVFACGGGAVALYNTSRAFAAVLQDGSICAWGEPSCGGDSTPAAQPSQLQKLSEVGAPNPQAVTSLGRA